MKIKKCLLGHNWSSWIYINENENYEKIIRFCKWCNKEQVFLNSKEY